jgi:hypothetical protein
MQSSKEEKVPDQDRRMLLAIVLSLGVYLLWFGNFGPQPEEDSALGLVETEMLWRKTRN